MHIFYKLYYIEFSSDITLQYLLEISIIYMSISSYFNILFSYSENYLQSKNILLIKIWYHNSFRITKIFIKIRISVKLEIL